VWFILSASHAASCTQHPVPMPQSTVTYTLPNAARPYRARATSAKAPHSSRLNLSLTTSNLQGTAGSRCEAPGFHLVLAYPTGATAKSEAVAHNKKAPHSPPTGTEGTQLAGVSLARPQAIVLFNPMQRGRFLHWASQQYGCRRD
jgi:hypothetical protein